MTFHGFPLFSFWILQVVLHCPGLPQ
jgi:hypothetical protein